MAGRGQGRVGVVAVQPVAQRAIWPGVQRVTGGRGEIHAAFLGWVVPEAAVLDRPGVVDGDRVNYVYEAVEAPE